MRDRKDFAATSSVKRQVRSSGNRLTFTVLRIWISGASTRRSRSTWRNWPFHRRRKIDCKSFVLYRSHVYRETICVNHSSLWISYRIEFLKAIERESVQQRIYSINIQYNSWWSLIELKKYFNNSKC